MRYINFFMNIVPGYCGNGNAFYNQRTGPILNLRAINRQFLYL